MDTISTFRAEDFLEKLAEFTGQDLSTTESQTENVAVNAEECNNGIQVKENTMEELNAAATAPIEEENNLEASAASDKKPEGVDAPKAEEPKAPEAPKADKPEGEKPGEDGKGQEKGKEDKYKAALEEILATCGDPKCKEIAEKALGKKADPLADPLGADKALPMDPAMGAPAAAAPADPALGVENCGDNCAPAKAPFANLVATLQRKASIGDSVWMIKNAADNSEFASFNVKAAFGDGLTEEDPRAQYATSEQFGRDVVASMAANNVNDVNSMTIAVLSVAAKYNPGYPSQLGTNKPSSHAKAQGKAEHETDKNICKDQGAKDAKAAVEAPLTAKAEAKEEEKKDDKKCVTCGKEKDNCNCEKKEAASTSDLKAEAAMGEGSGLEKKPGEDGKIPFYNGFEGGKVLPVKENHNTEESGHAKSGNKAETGNDKVFKMADYEAALKKQASENEALKKEIEALRIEAALKDKTAKVKECVSLMCNKGFIKADEEVRVASLKDGLSIEASNGRAMAAAIEKQAKYLYAMSTTQLDAYMSSLKGVSAPAITTSASTTAPLTIKASASAQTEEDRLLKVLGWD